MCSATMNVPSSSVACNKVITGRLTAKRQLSQKGSTSCSPNANANTASMPITRLGKDSKASSLITTCSHRPTASTGNDIRLRFLNRLGIQKQAPPQTKMRSCRKIHQDTTQDDDADSTGPTCSLSSSFSSSSTAKTRSVSFDNSVKVRPIPRFSDYSLETKHQIWADPVEIYENATRNSLEFAADNFDWQHAAEEDVFIPTETGELVHPIHYHRQQQQCNMQRNFLLVMAARRQACR